MDSEAGGNAKVPCSVCSAEVLVTRALIIRHVVMCEDCIFEAYQMVQRILRERGCTTPTIPTA